MTRDFTPTAEAGANPATDTELTLPTVVAAARGEYTASALTLTIAFHPDTQRIGQVAQVPVHDPTRPCVLGRRSPDFVIPGRSGGEPLGDPHVSRRALALAFTDNRLQITRFSGASRARLADEDLLTAADLSEQALRRGVPMLLGHAVVLVARLVDTRAPTDASDAAGRFLHGSGVAMARLRQQIAIAAGCDDDVLVRGETGTGKELVAQAVHAASARREGPMVSVNMAAIPADLAPALLFGTQRGAYTGAERSAPGYFQQAEGGTLFLDEIGDTPLPVQAQLLRALQQREIQVVGGRIRPVDVRVISATDAPLTADTAHFKAALLHRLGSHAIVVPPLRDHPEDIGELLWHFACEAAPDIDRQDLLPGRDADAADCAGWAYTVYQALRYHWPGNVRELRNVVRQTLRDAQSAMALPETFASRLQPLPADTPARETPVETAPVDVSEDAFAQAMIDCAFEPARVARVLGLSRTAVYRRIEASERHRLASDVPRAEIEAALAQQGADVAAIARQLRVSAAGLRQRLRAMGRHRS